MLRVCAKRCDECLFSSAKIVDEERKAEVLREAARKDTHFNCHKHTIRAMAKEGVGDGNVMCRGFYDNDPSATNLMRVMGRLGGVVFVGWDGRPVPQDQEPQGARRRR